MGRKRHRYSVNSNFTINDKSVEGFVVVEVGPCTFSGTLPSKAKKILKGDLTYVKFKFMDLKALKLVGLSKEHLEFTLLAGDVKNFLTELNEGQE